MRFVPPSTSMSRSPTLSWTVVPQTSTIPSISRASRNAAGMVAVYPLVVRPADNYRLVGREADSGRPEVAAFRDWLLSETKIDRTKNAVVPASVGDSKLQPTPLRG